uniref:Uncharacterized protein n=1 Tax=Rhodosorus marinus TaxID=101924 RepID=A0A7S0BR90_9RHOD|mmetsp:Transcript_4600/g.6368  ORF Transcript_4600/g.6368 Transcript_4600/m.6368 type:complete len:121 (+) Transcript_4600:768-1130(+)
MRESPEKDTAEGFSSICGMSVQHCSTLFVTEWKRSSPEILTTQDGTVNRSCRSIFWPGVSSSLPASTPPAVRPVPDQEGRNINRLLTIPYDVFPGIRPAVRQLLVENSTGSSLTYATVLA